MTTDRQTTLDNNDTNNSFDLQVGELKMFKLKNLEQYLGYSTGSILYCTGRNMYMLSGCELIDTKNIRLLSQNMKFVGE